MKRNIMFVLAVLLLSFVYIQGMTFIDNHQNKGKKPSISMESDILEVSVYDKEEKLLEGVYAKDEEDGDITSNVIIESISSFDENQYRTVNYAVFDSDGNVSRMVRQLRYVDYSAPVITLSKPFCLTGYSSDSELKEYVSAYSALDGDLAASIKVESVTYDGTNNKVVFSVSDSCGNRVEQEYIMTISNRVLSNAINLSTCIVHVPVGSYAINARSYIESMKGPMGNLYAYINQVNINDNVDYNTPGMYDIIYTLASDDGSFGMTKLVVIVE